jgi:hypothetical protein
MKVNHAEDALTAITTNSDCTKLISTDTAGRIKLWDISNVNFRKDTDPSSKMREIWFIQAHKALINQVTIVETFKDTPTSDSFILSCGGDSNILIHRLSTGQKVG